MKLIRPSGREPVTFITAVTLFFLLSPAWCARALAQTEPAVTSTASEEPEPTPTPGQTRAAADATQKRLTRARALAAIGKLAAAAAELESLRASTADDAVRDVTRVLLMAILVEMPDYQRASALLDEAFRARTPGRADDAATHSYFALAGQTVNAVRTHLDRYRSFGVNVTDVSELPSEASGDLEQLRNLLERVAEQAKALRAEQPGGGGPAAGARGHEATALLEDAATVRLRIPRHEQDRAQWQAHVSEARQQLFASETRIASISDPPRARPAATPAPAGASATAAVRPEQKNPSRQAQPESRPAAAETKKAPPPQQSAPANANAGARDLSNSPVAVGSLAGKAKQKVPPSYPAIAKAARISGVVTVHLIVNERGDVESIERADGPVQLQQAASDAARRWKFQPTVIDGQRVRVTGYLSFQFSL